MHTPETSLTGYIGGMSLNRQRADLKYLIGARSIDYGEPVHLVMQNRIPSRVDHLHIDLDILDPLSSEIVFAFPVEQGWTWQMLSSTIAAIDFSSISVATGVQE